MAKEVKIKICEKCGKEHTRPQSRFCCNHCGNSRVHSEERKQHQRKKLLEYHETLEGQATRKKASRIATEQHAGTYTEEAGIEDFAVNIPTIQDLRDFEDLLSGYSNAESW